MLVSTILRTTIESSIITTEYIAECTFLPPDPCREKKRLAEARAQVILASGCHTLSKAINSHQNRIKQGMANVEGHSPRGQAFAAPALQSEEYGDENPAG